MTIGSRHAAVRLALSTWWRAFRERLATRRTRRLHIRQLERIFG
jgi:hypothetical protein